MIKEKSAPGKQFLFLAVCYEGASTGRPEKVFGIKKVEM